ncbi:MAG TPA: pantetheine-phosphate adenylyltransferase [Bacteroidota bacterium]|nr:pantetheine-phosphate adenylyltransferase [Bacteroidota bacterium]
MKTALYPGTFDPITNGHLDILERALDLFDRVIVTVANNSSKTPLFTADERVELIQEIIDDRQYTNASVVRFDGLLVHFAKKNSAVALIRGLRAISDFEYEFQMALMNRNQAPEIATVFLMPHERYTYLNSSIVRELARLHGDYREFVPESVYTKMKLLFP